MQERAINLSEEEDLFFDELGNLLANYNAQINKTHRGLPVIQVDKREFIVDARLDSHTYENTTVCVLLLKDVNEWENMEQ